jgi:hypothetical protein
MKTNELTGAALDWAVALIEYPEWKEQGYLEVFPHDLSFDDGTTFAPSTNWAQGGPIIEREAITVSEGSPVVGLEWMACDRSSTHIQHGPTYLIAAMRCYVAAKLGDEVDVPQELR